MLKLNFNQESKNKELTSLVTCKTVKIALIIKHVKYARSDLICNWFVKHCFGVKRPCQIKSKRVPSRAGVVALCDGHV